MMHLSKRAAAWLASPSLMLLTCGIAGAAMMAGLDRFGGLTYTKSPDLSTTIALVEAGGGPGKFSAAAALRELVGEKITDSEVAKLTQQYGKASVDSFLTVFDYAVNDAAAIATKDGVTFPSPRLSGERLAKQIVADGTEHGMFWTGYLLDHLVTHNIHEQTMSDIDAKYGAAADENYHKISNQAFYDLAQAIGDKSVGVASLH